MGVVLDKGASTDEVEEKPPFRPDLGWSAFIFVLAFTFAVVMVIIGTVIDSNSDVWLLASSVGVVATITAVFVVFDIFSQYKHWKDDVVSRSVPADSPRSWLRFTPTDGSPVELGPSGGFATHLVTECPGSWWYVIVVATNGIGVSPTFTSYQETTEWEREFCHTPTQLSLRKAIPFDEIIELHVDQADVVIVSRSDSMRLDEWFDLNDPASQARVRGLIDTLGFVENRNKPGVFSITDASPRT